MADALVEKSPRSDRVCDETERIAQDDLCANGPVEPPDIARVAPNGVDSGSDELVAVLSRRADQMVEVVCGSEHGGFSDNFTRQADNNTNQCDNIHSFKT